MTPHSWPRGFSLRPCFSPLFGVFLSEGSGRGPASWGHFDQAIELLASVERIMQILKVLPRDFYVLVINKKRKNVIIDMIL